MESPVPISLDCNCLQVLPRACHDLSAAQSGPWRQLSSHTLSTVGPLCAQVGFRGLGGVVVVWLFVVAHLPCVFPASLHPLSVSFAASGSSSSFWEDAAAL